LRSFLLGNDISCKKSLLALYQWIHSLEWLLFFCKLPVLHKLVFVNHLTINSYRIPSKDFHIFLISMAPRRKAGRHFYVRGFFDVTGATLFSIYRVLTGLFG